MSRSNAGPWRRVAVRMWRPGGSFSRLSPLQPSGQALFLFLLTGPVTTQIPGVCIGGEAGMAEMLGWPLKQFRGRFAELFRERLAVPSWEHRLVWLPAAIRYNLPNNPNQIKGWGKAFRDLPECPLKVQIYDELYQALKPLGKPFAESFVKSFPKPLRNDYANGMAIQEQEQEQEQENKRERCTHHNNKRFQRPTVKQVRDYCQRMGYTFDPESFVAYYEANGWKVGRVPMKSWKAACTTWQKREDAGKHKRRASQVGASQPVDMDAEQQAWLDEIRSQDPDTLRRWYERGDVTDEDLTAAGVAVDMGGSK